MADNEKPERQKAAERIVEKNIKASGGKLGKDGKWHMDDGVEAEKERQKNAE
jgi:hypothetical protein